MVKVGIIGSGFGLYGLLPAFNTTKNYQVVCICGEKTKRLVDYCHGIGLTNIYTDWKKMLDSEYLDAVAIAVTPNAQYKIAKAAITKGLHVFAEKPLAASLPQAKELLSLAKRKKITHAIDFIFPEIEQWQKVKQVIADKTYGKLKHISSNWDFLSFDIKNKKSSWKTDVKEGGGALSFYFSHCLYYLEYFAGKLSNLKSLFFYSERSLNGGEVGIDLLLKFKQGITGYAHLSCNTIGLNKHKLIFTFEDGTIVLACKNDPFDFTIEIHTGNKIKKLNNNKDNKQLVSNQDPRVRLVKRLTDRFLKACIYNQQIIPSFKEGVRVQELIEKTREEQI